MDDNDDISDLTCDPIDSYDALMKYMENPPNWAKYCIEIKHKRATLVKNADLYKNNTTICHLNVEPEEVPLYSNDSLPKTLVCHDMANGYHDDSFIRGTANYAAYNFYNWSGIDIFCYFSHHFVTIPPLGWINIAHGHGVKIIGTIITEWNDGFKLCERITQSENEYKKFSHIIVAITKYYKMDGWLLNIENKITKPQMFLDFVGYLKNKLHTEVPGSLLIWYDSVTVHGDLRWQNGLTSENKAFFDVSDGIFTNYSWDISHLVETVQLAQERRYDVFVGVDVWGRNFFGGGQFNTALAVKAIHDHNLSIAVFAQAWTHEAVDKVELYKKKFEEPFPFLSSRRTTDPCHSNYDDFIKDDFFKTFLLRDKAFWNSIWQYLNTRGPSALPFKTSFCRGQGVRKMFCGELYSNLSWFNLRSMQYQPTCEPTSYGYKLIEQPQPDKTDASPNDENAAGVSQIEREDEISVPIEITDHRNVTGCDKENIKVTSRPDIIEAQRQTADSTTDSKVSRKPPVTRFTLVEDDSQNPCVEQYFDDAFNGGSCLKISIHETEEEFDKARLMSRLFTCNFTCKSKLIFYTVTKNLPLSEKQFLNIVLIVKDVVMKHSQRLVLVGSEVEVELASGSIGRVLYPVRSRSEVEFEQLQKHILLKIPRFYVSQKNGNDWQVRYYLIEMPNTVVTEMFCELGVFDGGPMLLGQLGVCEY